MNKRQLLEQMQAGYAEWLALLDTIPPERISEPGAVGHWTVKDIIAHIAAEHRWLAAQLDAAAHRQRPPEQRPTGASERRQAETSIAHDQDRKEWNYERHKGWPLDAVIAEAGFAYESLVRMIEGLPEETLAATYTVARYGNINHIRPATCDDAVCFPLWRLLYDGTTADYQSHIEDIEHWRTLHS